ITLAAWPEANDAFVDALAVKEMDLLMGMIKAVRNVRAEVNVPMSKKVELIIKPAGTDAETIIRKNMPDIERFCGTSQLTIDSDMQQPDKAMSAIVSGAELYLPLAGLIDISQEIARLEKELKTLNNE